MTAMRQEAIDLLEKVPEDKLKFISNYSAGLRIHCADRTKRVNSAMQRVN